MGGAFRIWSAGRKPTVKVRAIEIGSRGVVGPISESGCEIRHPVGPISILKKLCHGVGPQRTFSSPPAAARRVNWRVVLKNTGVNAEKSAIQKTAASTMH